MAEKKHFYAVLKGRSPGIYTRWSGTGGAEEQIKGYPGAVFRGFATRGEAEYYLRSGGVVMPAETLFPMAEEEAPAAQAAAQARAQKEYQPDLAAGKVVIFADGASTGNPGPGGYGVVLLAGDSRNELSGGFRCTTNNRMELLGVITALRALKQRETVVLYCDSRYVVDAVEKGWARRWRARGWMRDADNPENERCDQLAVQAAHQKNLPEDEGFAGKC